MIDVAFCAGFFDADGCCSNKRTTVTLYWYNDSLEVLELIARTLQVSNTPRPKKKPKGGTTYYLAVGDRNVVLALVEKFLEIGCVVKRKKLLEAREILSKTHIRKNGWTEDEDAILRTTLDRTGKEVSELVGRTPDAIRMRRSNLGLRAHKHNFLRTKRRSWAGKIKCNPKMEQSMQRAFTLSLTINAETGKGYSVRAIGKILDVPKSTIHRWNQRCQQPITFRTC